MRRVRKAQLMLAVKLTVVMFIVLQIFSQVASEPGMIRQILLLVTTRHRISTWRYSFMGFESNDTTATIEVHQELPDPAVEAFKASFGTQRSNVCAGNLQIFDSKFARLKQVVLNTDLLSGPTGGETVRQVLNRPEEQEYPTLQKGFFQLSCPDAKFPTVEQANLGLGMTFNRGPIKRYFDKLTPRASDVAPTATKERVTFLLTRIEYANLCHTTAYFYNAFLMLAFFALAPQDVDVLIMDAHAAGNLDDVWGTMFGNNVTRVGMLPKGQRILHQDMVWVPEGYDSALLNHRSFDPPPLLENFRSFFLRRHGVAEKNSIDCSNLVITFIWRRDYVAHPRNPAGRLSRKIKNEQQLLEAVSSHPEFANKTTVRGVQLDTMTMKEQLDVIAKTDVLIGAHGAGLTHLLFMPKHSAVIEIYPRRYRSSPRFPSMARWRKLQHYSWQSPIAGSEEWTDVSPSDIVTLVANAVHINCGVPTINEPKSVPNHI